jgi:hypothetical protein
MITLAPQDLNGKDVIYESSVELLLKVDKIVLPPIDDALTQKVRSISDSDTFSDNPI